MFFRSYFSAISHVLIFYRGDSRHRHMVLFRTGPGRHSRLSGNSAAPCPDHRRVLRLVVDSYSGAAFGGGRLGVRTSREIQAPKDGRPEPQQLWHEHVHPGGRRRPTGPRRRLEVQQEHLRHDDNHDEQQPRHREGQEQPQPQANLLGRLAAARQRERGGAERPSLQGVIFQRQASQAEKLPRKGKVQWKSLRGNG